MPRLPPITSIEQIPEKDRHFAETIVASRGAISGPFTAFLHSPEVAARARFAVERLEALAPGTVPTLTASARYKYLIANDLAGAVADGMAAIKLAPSDVEVLRLASQVEQIRGDWAHALTHAETAVRVDPRSRPARRSLLTVQLSLKQYREAAVLARELLGESPADLSVLESLATTYLIQV